MTANHIVGKIRSIRLLIVFLQIHRNEAEIRRKKAASIQGETPGQPEDTLGSQDLSVLLGEYTDLRRPSYASFIA